MRRFVHTPEGVRDIYGKECMQKRLIESNIHDTFALYGYDDIETPTFEFFDVFGREIGTTPSKELYKFFDKEGNTLVLRPDFTPSIGRCAAKYFMEEKTPVRLTYKGNAYTNTSNLQGKLKEATQMGAELIGDDSILADAEMVHLAVAALKAAGLKEFQISIGQVDFFRGICNACNLDEETELDLREFISNKNYFGAEELLRDKEISQDKINVLLEITELFESSEVLDEALTLVDNETSKAAIARLKELYDLLVVYGDENYVSFDLGMLSRYHYYTGIIFKGYTYGLGDAVVSGGRYNKLISYFGKNAPSVGFVIHIDGLMQALNSRRLLPVIENHKTACIFEKEFAKEAIAFAKNMRGEGKVCELVVMKDDMDETGYIEEAKKSTLKALYKIDGSGATLIF